jgi:hypothetical protein
MKNQFAKRFSHKINHKYDHIETISDIEKNIFYDFLSLFYVFFLFLCFLFILQFFFFFNSYEIKYNPTKYIEATEKGLVVMSVNESDGGRYDCYLGGSLLCSFTMTVDAHR